MSEERPLCDSYNSCVVFTAVGANFGQCFYTQWCPKQDAIRTSQGLPLFQVVDESQSGDRGNAVAEEVFR